jgi:hypothetical protein
MFFLLMVCHAYPLLSPTRTGVMAMAGCGLPRVPFSDDSHITTERIQKMTSLAIEYDFPCLMKAMKIPSQLF